MKKLLSSKKVIIAAIITIVLIVAIVIISTMVLPTFKKYKQAQETFESGNFTEAIELFREIEGYKDSSWQIVRCELALARINISKNKDIITFGSYEQDGIIENGAEPISWRVVEYDQQSKIATLISSNILDAQPINDSSSTTNNWENSKIRQWLNTTFINTAFTVEQQSAIMVSTAENTFSATTNDIQKTTVDKIHLPRIAETGGISFTPKVTAYAQEQGAIAEANGNPKVSIWTRNQYKKDSAQYVAVVYSGYFAYRYTEEVSSDRIIGICPTMQLNLDY